MNDITAAETLPDEEGRRAAAALLCEQMTQKAEECRDYWQRLKLYIEEAFPENEIDIHLNAAGAAHYLKASANNWDSVKRIMIDGEAFITANTVALQANNNMPAGFLLEFATANGEFETLYNNFINASLDSELQTQTKINANNTVFKDLTSMLKDGQRIFKNDEALKNNFTFDQLLSDIAGGGQAGLKGTVTAEITSEPIEGVIVKIIGTDKQANTDALGKYHITQVAASTYDIEHSKIGYITKLVEDIEIQTGITKTLDTALTPNP
ncbi:hypothetical protein OJ253_3705 [Cryptosporidium canis]|uniref:Uncharacterized protein n=1 Tax=Cryptosporidium canis TaxID=195482 RepID=A0A9D5HX17_9CRYT|nr:hypothetical protein OJ253_3705 [Cryptosporidium canis]